MSLIALKCPNCGAELELDGTKEFAFCVHCGTKIMIQKVAGYNSEASKLSNLKDLALKSVGTGSSSELRSISMKILEIDSKDWVGWFVKGVAEAKEGRCEAMYDAWNNAVQSMTKRDYKMMKNEIAHYAAVGSIGYGCEGTDSGFPEDLFRNAHVKESAGGTLLAKLIIDEMCKLEGQITIDTCADAILNGYDIVYSHLNTYAHLGTYLICYSSLTKLYIIANNTIGMYEEARQQLESIMLPFRTLAKSLVKRSISDEDYDKASKYWSEHNPEEYMAYFDTAYDLSDDLMKAGSLKSAFIKMKMKKSIDTMLDVYFSHN